MRKLKTSKVPPGGWRYLDRPYGSFITAQEVIEAETQYRLENLMPVGDVEGDITEWVCNQWPTYCTGGASVFEARISRTHRILDRVTSWASKWLKEGFNQTLPSIAQERARACVKCPYNISWDGCGKCGSNIKYAKRMFGIIRSMKEVQGSDKLHACDIMGWDNRTGIWNQNPPEPKPEVPEFCWLRPKS